MQEIRYRDRDNGLEERIMQEFFQAVSIEDCLGQMEKRKKLLPKSTK